MIFLLQIINIVGIEQMHNEITALAENKFSGESFDLFFEFLDSCHGIEVSNSQRQSVENVIISGKYKAAIKVIEMQKAA